MVRRPGHHPRVLGAFRRVLFRFCRAARACRSPPFLGGVLAGCESRHYLEAFTPETVPSDLSFYAPTQVTAGNEANFAPDLSPNGEFVLYTSDRTGNKDIWQKRTSGGFAEQLTTHPADDFAPVLSPDAKHLAFISRRFDAAGDVTIADIGFSFAHIFGSTESTMRNVSSPQTEDTSPAWFPGSTRLVFAARRPGERTPALMQASLTKLQPEPLDDLRGEQPSVAPDGKDPSPLFAKAPSICTIWIRIRQTS